MCQSREKYEEKSYSRIETTRRNWINRMPPKRVHWLWASYFLLIFPVAFMAILLILTVLSVDQRSHLLDQRSHLLDSIIYFSLIAFLLSLGMLFKKLVLSLLIPERKIVYLLYEEKERRKQLRHSLSNLPSVGWLFMGASLLIFPGLFIYSKSTWERIVLLSMGVLTFLTGLFFLKISEGTRFESRMKEQRKKRSAIRRRKRLEKIHE